MSAPQQTLRLLWPQWQGASLPVVAELLPEVPIEAARTGYAVGTAVLQAVLPSHPGTTARVPVEPTVTDEVTVVDGVESKDVVLRQLSAGLATIGEHDPARILTLGGDCSVSVAPFASLAARYGDDLALVWIDAHPDVGLPGSENAGHHAMAVSLLTGHGDPDLLAALPGRLDPSRVALAGLHSWDEGDIGNVSAWGITSFSPQDLRDGAGELVAWLRSTGCSRVAVHLDVDVVDSDEVVLGLGMEPGGMRIDEVRALLAALDDAADVVGLTVAEFIPRQVLFLQRLLDGAPLTR
ncbi:arginase family protein [Nocardioides bruguierae]|uniref:arginase family protein n=1 Tax=Nocardioides bruguierae TaxID=2945102 RepID=UPI002021D6E3|nr:arginase family protein [Nocardioides bruguierae]MCL8026889.1 arginase family protein [Nocardioides bruguierae]